MEDGGKDAPHITAVGFRDECFPTSIKLGSWDFPLSRSEKLRRVLLLYQAEVDASSRAARQSERQLRYLRLENSALSQRGNTRREPNTEATDVAGSGCSARVEADDAHECHGLLKFSLRGTAAMRDNECAGDCLHALQPVQELQHSDAAVTCMCFGREMESQSYILLALASSDCTVSIYRCYRTETETAMLTRYAFHETVASFDKPSAGAASYMEMHSAIIGHSAAVTAVFFDDSQAHLITASLDRTIRFWVVDSGEMLRVFVNGSSIKTATLLSLSTATLVAAATGAVLRLIDVRNGTEVQISKCGDAIDSLEMERHHEACLLVGTSHGCIHVFEINHLQGMRWQFKIQLTDKGIIRIKSVTDANARKPSIMVNTSDGHIWILDCQYGARGVLCGMTSRRQVVRSVDVRSCCYVPSDRGYIVCGSAHGDLLIHSLDQDERHGAQHLRHHTAPVLEVAVNLQNTLLASADASGRIVLWRRLNFSHLRRTGVGVMRELDRTVHHEIAERLSGSSELFSGRLAK